MDGHSKPFVNCPFGNFFGTGFGEYKHYMSRYLGMTCGGYICLFQMPFKKKARIEIVNTDKEHTIPALYGAITYAKYESEEDLKDVGYFRAKYNHEYPTTKDVPYTILDTSGGRGHFMGFTLNAIALRKKDWFSYLEGNTKMFVDGEQTLEYTGTEDIFQGAWYYIRGKNRKQAEFDTMYHGLTIKSTNKRQSLGEILLQRFIRNKTSQYRFFPEAIPFKNSLKVTLHHGEFDEIPANYDSVSYWYQE